MTYSNVEKYHTYKIELKTQRIFFIKRKLKYDIRIA